MAKLVHRWNGSTHTMWSVERETEKTIFLKRLNARSYDTYRLPKKELDQGTSWLRGIWSFDIGLIIAAIERDVEDARVKLDQLQSSLRTAKANTENTGENHADQTTI